MLGIAEQRPGAQDRQRVQPDDDHGEPPERRRVRRVQGQAQAQQTLQRVDHRCHEAQTRGSQRVPPRPPAPVAVAVEAGEAPTEVDGCRESPNPAAERDPADVDGRDQGDTGNDEAIRQRQEGGLGEVLPRSVQIGRIAEGALRTDRDGDEEQADEGAAGAGAGQKKLTEALRGHIAILS
jgi:hypothetical protein